MEAKPEKKKKKLLVKHGKDALEQLAACETLTKHAKHVPPALWNKSRELTTLFACDLITKKTELKDVSLTELDLTNLEEIKNMEDGFPLEAVVYADLIRGSWHTKWVILQECLAALAKNPEKIPGDLGKEAIDALKKKLKKMRKKDKLEKAQRRDGSQTKRRRVE